VPELVPSIVKAIEADPTIPESPWKNSFEKLILQPLSELTWDPQQAWILVIVIDALDECKREDACDGYEEKEDVKDNPSSVSKSQGLTPVCLRIFATSRQSCQSASVLRKCQKTPTRILSYMIFPRQPSSMIYLSTCTMNSRRLRDQNSKRGTQYALPLDWPGETNVQSLVEMASPLFIVAATVCRLVGDQGGTRKSADNDIWVSHGKSCLPSSTERICLSWTSYSWSRWGRERRTISRVPYSVGAIVILADPLSTISLSNLLHTSKGDVDSSLGLLHSVLDIPTDESASVRLLHLSFRDFLLDPRNVGKARSGLMLDRHTRY